MIYLKITIGLIVSLYCIVFLSKLIAHAFINNYLRDAIILTIVLAIFSYAAGYYIMPMVRQVL